MWFEWWLGTDVIDPGTPITWVNLGVLGLLALGAIRGMIWFHPAVSRILKQWDASQDENQKLNAFIREVVVPTMAASTEAMKQAHDAQVRSGAHQMEVVDALEELQRSVDKLKEEQARTIAELQRRSG